MMLALTIVRALSLLASSVCLLIALIVAWPTERLLDGGWLLGSITSVAVYIASTWGFLLASNRYIARHHGGAA